MNVHPDLVDFEIEVLRTVAAGQQPAWGAANNEAIGALRGRRLVTGSPGVTPIEITEAGRAVLVEADKES